MARFPALIGIAALLQSCAWVTLTPEGEKVRVLEADEVASCRELGTTTSSVKDDVAGIGRRESKVAGELESLARNAAAEMNGDTIVARGAPEDGRQAFTVYRCVNP